MVTLSDILPNIHQLTFLDKIRLIRILAEEIDSTSDHAQSFFESKAIYNVYTPQFEPGAADILMQALEDSKDII